MMVRSVVTLAILVAGSFGSLSSAAELRPEMERLFKLGWQNTADAREAAAAQAAVVEQLAPTDLRVQYAQALVLMKQRKYTEASTLLDRVIAANKQNHAAWRAKIFLAMLTKEYGRATAAMDVYTGLLTPEVAGAPTSDWEESAGFLGRMFGFLEGPAEGTAEAQVAALKAKVETRLVGKLGSLFNDGRTATLEKFAELTGDKTRLQADNQALAEKAAADQKEQNEKTKEQIAERITQLRSDSERAKSEFDQAVADIDRQAAPLRGQLAAAATIVNQIEGSLLSNINQINQLLNDIAREKDPNRKNQLQREVDRLRFFQRRIDNDLAVARGNANGINAQLSVLLNQRAAAQGRFSGEMNRIDREAKALGKQDARIDAITKQLDKPKSGNSPKTRALSVQAAALSTYDQFPLDAERDRLLLSFDVNP